MNKIYAIHQRQKEQVDKWCFGECKEILLGGVFDDTIGYCFTCAKRDCPHEKKNMEYGESNSGIVYLRILKEHNNE
jgi:hypothetical protein